MIVLVLLKKKNNGVEDTASRPNFVELLEQKMLLNTFKQGTSHRRDVELCLRAGYPYSGEENCFVLSYFLFCLNCSMKLGPDLLRRKKKNSDLSNKSNKCVKKSNLFLTLFYHYTCSCPIM